MLAFSGSGQSDARDRELWALHTHQALQKLVGVGQRGQGGKARANQSSSRACCACAELTLSLLFIITSIRALALVLSSSRAVAAQAQQRVLEERFLQVAGALRACVCGRGRVCVSKR